MARLKVEEDVDLEELENAEYDPDKEGEFTPYDGPLPPVGTLLRGYIKKMWYTLTKNDDGMLVVLFIAEGNKGSKAKYDGLPIWERIALTSGAKFKWYPFLSAIGLTIADAVKKLYTSGDADNTGDPVEKIAGWRPGEDEDGAYVNVLTDREKYNGEWQTRAGRFLPWTDPGEAEEPGDEDAGDENPEPEDPEPPKASAGRRSARTAKAEPEEDEQPKGGRATRGRAAATSKPAAGRSAPTRGRGRGSSKGDEPPF